MEDDTQTRLFDNPKKPVPKIPPYPSGTPAPVGSAGLEEEFCKTCAHFERVKYHDYWYLKCGLMSASWTHGPGTDIKANWPACRQWRPLNHPLQYHGGDDDVMLRAANDSLDGALIFADWLEERGDCRRAAAIRFIVAEEKRNVAEWTQRRNQIRDDDEIPF